MRLPMRVWPWGQTQPRAAFGASPSLTKPGHADIEPQLTAPFPMRPEITARSTKVYSTAVGYEGKWPIKEGEGIRKSTAGAAVGTMTGLIHPLPTSFFILVPLFRLSMCFTPIQPPRLENTISRLATAPPPTGDPVPAAWPLLPQPLPTRCATLQPPRTTWPLAEKPPQLGKKLSVWDTTRNRPHCEVSP